MKICVCDEEIFRDKLRGNLEVSAINGEVGEEYREQSDNRRKGNVKTGWEDERAIFEGIITGEGNDDSIHEANEPYRFDTDGDYDNPGTYAAYLLAGIASVSDDRQEHIEDCTTIHYKPERKKKEQYSGPVMRGM